MVVLGLVAGIVSYSLIAVSLTTFVTIMSLQAPARPKEIAILNLKKAFLVLAHRLLI
jgi:hypothetical protein